MKLSYSRLSVYLDCGYQFALKYLGAARYNESSDALDVGKAVHWALEQTVKEMVAAGLVGMQAVPIDKVLAYYEKVAVDETGLMTFEGYHDGLAIIRSLKLTFDPSLVLEVEGEFDDPIAGTPHSIGGFIDRVAKVDEETMEVLDYKTGKILVTAEHNKQLMIYAWSLAKRYSWAQKFRLVIEMIRTGETSVWTISREEVDKMGAWLTHVANRLEREIAAFEEDKQLALAAAEQGEAAPSPRAFGTKIGANCQWCPFAGLCLKTHPLGSADVKAGNTMESMVAEFVRLQTIGKRAYGGMYKVLAKIEQAAMKTDVTQVDTPLGTFRLESDMDFTLPDVVDVFKAHNTKVSPYLKLDFYKLKALAAKPTELGASLRKVARPKVSVVEVKDEEY